MGHAHGFACDERNSAADADPRSVQRDTGEHGDSADRTAGEYRYRDRER
jgi:hypothetical protein